MSTIEQNIMTFHKLCGRLGDRSEAVTRLVEALAVQISTAPASTRVDYHDCFPGGLVSYSLRVLKLAKTLNDSFEMNCSAESMILVSLFHAIGKAGDLHGPMYLEEESEWHREKLGKHFKIREGMQKMPVPDRSLYLLQHFGVQLEQDEWLAIKLSDGRYRKEHDSYYDLAEPKLALLLDMASRTAIRM